MTSACRPYSDFRCSRVQDTGAQQRDRWPGSFLEAMGRNGLMRVKSARVNLDALAQTIISPAASCLVRWRKSRTGGRSIFVVPVGCPTEWPSPGSQIASILTRFGRFRNTNCGPNRGRCRRPHRKQKRHQDEKYFREILSSAPYAFERGGVVCRLLPRLSPFLCQRDSTCTDDEDRQYLGALCPLRQGLRVVVVPEPSPHDVFGQVSQNGRRVIGDARAMLLDSFPPDERRHHLPSNGVVDIDDEPDMVVVRRLHDEHERGQVVRKQVPPMLTSDRVVHVINHPVNASILTRTGVSNASILTRKWPCETGFQELTMATRHENAAPDQSRQTRKSLLSQ